MNAETCSSFSRPGADGAAARTPSAVEAEDVCGCGCVNRVAVRDRVFRLSAAAVNTFTEDAVAARSIARPVKLHAELTAVTGERARLELRAAGERVFVEGEALLEPAAKAHLNAGRARDAVGALGGTPYRLAHFGSRLEGDPFLPVGALKALRRRALAELDGRRLARLRRPAAPPPGRSCRRLA